MSKIIPFPTLTDLPNGEIVVSKNESSLHISYTFGYTHNKKYEWLIKEAIHIAEDEIWQALEATRDRLISRIMGLRL
jgi:NOL1/NOP2/fmu family ribosome biogenesis protein